MAKRAGWRGRHRKFSGSAPKAAKPRALLYWRIRRGFSLMELARRAKLSPATLNRIESGRGTISIRARIRLMDNLRLSAKALDVLLAPVDRKRQPRRRRSSVPGPSRLHKWRLRHNFTLKTLSKLAGLSVAEVYRIERGLVQARSKTLGKLVSVMKRLNRRKRG